MTSVRPFEAEILRVLHATFGATPVDRVMPSILARRPRPSGLGPPGLRLVREALALGSVRSLARRGGWPVERFLRGERVLEGRLWDRTPPEELGLEFSGRSIELLFWLVAETPTPEPTPAWPAPGGTMVGDDLLAFFVFEAFRDTSVGPALRMMPLFRRHALCRLAFPADFAKPDPVDFDPWTAPPRAWILEALQPTLATAWVAADRARLREAELARRTEVAREQGRVADAFLASVDSARRRDLARFFLRAARELLGARAGLAEWTGPIEAGGMALAERSDAMLHALAALSCLDRLRAWRKEARGVGYFDDGYAAAQLALSDWERTGGDGLREAARALRRAADPLGSPVDREGGFRVE